MFIVNLIYKVPLETIDEYIDDHKTYLTKQYEQSNFLMSGRKVPRIGGIIISNLKSKEELLKVLEEDPFKENDLADYEIFEFLPNNASAELSFLLE